MKSKKFALIGTSCTGKTTCLYELEKILKKKYRNKKIIVVPEAARYYFEKEKTRKPFSYTHQHKIQNIAKQFEESAEKELPSIIICDRSVIDAIAYVKTTGTENESKKLLQRVKKWLATYSHFFLLSPDGVPYKTDLIRKEDVQMRKSFHTSFLYLLKKLALPHTLISGDKKQRLKKIKNIIFAFDI